MLALKRIMQEEGIVTPFCTTTAWGGAVTPAEEALPLWGGYSYQPWIFYDRTGEHPATPEYIYRDNHNDAVPESYNFKPDYPPESLTGGKQTLLRICYAGDIGHAFINGRMIRDNFANGAAWHVRLDCHREELSRHPLTIYITPCKADVTVDVSSAMAGRMEKATGLTAELFSAEIVRVTEIAF